MSPLFCSNLETDNTTSSSALESFPKNTLFPAAIISFFDIDKLVFPLIIRSFKAGDSFVPFGMKGRKKLKKLFNDNKIPVNKKGSVPLVISSCDIIFVAGIHVSDIGKVDAGTRQILKIRHIVA